jgi:acylglycerol lipase
MREMSRENGHRIGRWFFTVVIGTVVSACTHVPEPKLTATERQTARQQLLEWPEGQIVSLTGTDGVRLQARLYRPPGKPVATVVAMHGLETHSKWFALLATELNKRNIAVLAMDRRGSGLNCALGGNGQMGEDQSYQMWLDDILAHVKYTHGYGAKVYVMGNSWGGNPILAWSETPEAHRYAHGAVLLTPGLASRKPNILQKLAIGFAGNKALLGTCLGVEDYSRKRSTWALLEEDHKLTKEVSARFFKQTRSMQTKALNGLASEKIPILLICAEQDELMKNEEMRCRLGAQLPHQLYTESILDNDYHLALIEDTTRVSAEIAKWMQAH